MYSIFTNIYPINDTNVGKYTIHGASRCVKHSYLKYLLITKHRLLGIPPPPGICSASVEGNEKALYRRAQARHWDGQWAQLSIRNRESAHFQEDIVEKSYLTDVFVQICFMMVQNKDHQQGSKHSRK